jgi:hypothetical protein
VLGVIVGVAIGTLLSPVLDSLGRPSLKGKTPSGVSAPVTGNRDARQPEPTTPPPVTKPEEKPADKPTDKPATPEPAGTPSTPPAAPPTGTQPPKP